MFRQRVEQYKKQAPIAIAFLLGLAALGFAFGLLNTWDNFSAFMGGLRWAVFASSLAVCVLWWLFMIDLSKLFFNYYGTRIRCCSRQ